MTLEKFPGQQHSTSSQSSNEKKNLTTEENTPEVMMDLISKIIKEAENYTIKEDDKNEKGELLVSPEGVVSNLGKKSELWWKIARTKTFKKFFGDWQNEANAASKILDKNGEPLVLFRGIHSHFNLEDFYNKEFYNNTNQGYKHGDGIYFSPDPKVAENFASVEDGKVEGGVFPAFINARNLLYKESKKDAFNTLGNELQEKLRLLIPVRFLKMIPKISLIKYDSTISLHGGYRKAEDVEDSDEIVLKSPDQILIIPNEIKRPSEL